MRSAAQAQRSVRSSGDHLPLAGPPGARSRAQGAGVCPAPTPRHIRRLLREELTAPPEQRDAWVRILRSLRRKERVAALLEQGWSREEAERHVYHGGDGVVAAWLESQDPSMTKRVATGGQLADRKSGRKRRKPRRRWTRWNAG